MILLLLASLDFVLEGLHLSTPENRRGKRGHSQVPGTVIALEVKPTIKINTVVTQFTTIGLQGLNDPASTFSK